MAGGSDETDDETQSAAVSSERSSETESDSGYTEQELQEIELLATRDREVRQHEQAHAAAGGQYAGAPSYELTRGPDGRMYATGGEVMIDTSEVPGDPVATIQKMQTVISSALAPAEPSSQDRQVAAEATAMMQQAQAELGRAEQSDESDEVDEVAETDESAEAAEADDIDSGSRSDSLAGSAQNSDSAGSRLASQASDRWGAQSHTLHSFQPSAEQQALERRLMSSGVLAESSSVGSLIEQMV
ncbi:putative metalloprotease CJM1_0395 family protein [Marinobacterium arenosum]|uniref:putative metalloprotease CJM1_0395 family protein n=1 Tax=Marinobacterium arenosum TaxID=2862496 RepID=UPI0036F387CC